MQKEDDEHAVRSTWIAYAVNVSLPSLVFCYTLQLHLINLNFLLPQSEMTVNNLAA